MSGPMGMPARRKPMSLPIMNIGMCIKTPAVTPATPRTNAHSPRRSSKTVVKTPPAPSPPKRHADALPLDHGELALSTLRVRRRSANLNHLFSREGKSPLHRPRKAPHGEFSPGIKIGGAHV